MSGSTLAENRPGFSSFKTGSDPIHYQHRWHRDALIQLTLDPTITALRRISDPVSGLPSEISGALIAFHGSAPVLVGLADQAIEVKPSVVSGLPFVALTRQEIRTDPRVTTARTIWSTRAIQVAPGDRIRILQRLTNQPAGLPILTLQEEVRSSAEDPINCILALVCDGLLSIDASRHLTPETIVSRCEMPSRDHTGAGP
ncbi:hypothetical protein AA309_11110 [Microvirga vignae]|uniref:Uncharacterized protein n=2 Tax=Microvirga vignae TaxID=1225564 RepID=A0A0H1RDY1_9HYPH|nr:hypothetical protein AA309_11110 [Microvirga vignae]